MIVVKYVNRLGNNLFQYALGRYIAEEMGYELIAPPLPFPATHERIKGRSFQTPQQAFGVFHIDIESILADKSDRAILLDGYFQHYNYYKSYMDRIRKWYAHPLPSFLPQDITKDDLLVYIRLGDYDYHGWSLKFSFYEAAINMAKPSRIFIVTEDRNHPFLRRFAVYNPTIISQDPLSDLLMAKLFKKVAISCSTFSWWAAVLAEPDEVYVPIADSGLWSHQTMQFPNYEQDLRIDSEKFIYFYNSPVITSNREAHDYLPIAEVDPDRADLNRFAVSANEFHQNSRAYWFL